MDTTIRFYRKKINMTQQELADILKLPRTEVSFIETKKILPKYQIIENIAEALNVPIGKLYTKEELDFIRYKIGNNHD